MNSKVSLFILLLFTVLVSGCVDSGDQNRGNNSTPTQISTESVSNSNKNELPTGWFPISGGYFKNVTKLKISDTDRVVPIILIMNTTFSDSDTANYFFSGAVAKAKDEEARKSNVEVKNISIIPDCSSYIRYYNKNAIFSSNICLKKNAIVYILMEGAKLDNEGRWNYPIDEKKYVFSFDDELEDMERIVNLIYNN